MHAQLLKKVRLLHKRQERFILIQYLILNLPNLPQLESKNRLDEKEKEED